MKGKPSLDEFRTGGGEELQAARKGRPVRQEGIEDRITKTIRIARAQDLRLKEEVLRSVREGETRRSESDLIDEALTLYWEHLAASGERRAEV